MKSTAHEAVKGVRLIKADAHAAATITGAGVDCTGFGELLATISIDDVGAAGTVNFKLQESSDDGVADAYVDIAGAAIAAKTAAGLFVGRLDLEQRERYIRGILVIGVNAVDACVLGSLIPNKNRPVSQVATKEFSV